MSAPELLLLVPLISGIGAYLSRRWLIVTKVISIGTIPLLLIILLLTEYDASSQGPTSLAFLDNNWLSLTGPFFLGHLQRNIILLLYIGSGIVLVFYWLLIQGELFAPLMLLTLSPLAGMLMATSTTVGAAFLVASAGLMTVIIQGERAGSTLTSFRYFSLVIVAYPGLLTLGWLLEYSPAVHPTWAPFFVLLTMLILLFSFPFHIWVSPTVSEVMSLAPIVVFGLAQLVVLFFMFGMLSGNPAIYRNARLLLLLRVSGAGTLLMAVALTLTAPTIGRLLGYVLLIDIGSTTIALGLGGEPGLELATFIIINRVVGLMLAGLGLGMIRQKLPPNKKEGILSPIIEHLGRSSPFGLALLIFGYASLAGLPFTPGFAGRWSLVALVSEQHRWLAIIIVLSVVAAFVGLSRMLLPRSAVMDEEAGGRYVEGKALQIASLLLLLLGVLMTLFTSSVLSFSQSLVSAL